MRSENKMSKIELITTGIPEVSRHRKRGEKEGGVAEAKCNIRYVRQNESRRGETHMGSKRAAIVSQPLRMKMSFHP